MILPIGDAPNARGHVPIVTYLLLAANVGVFFLVTLPLSDAPAPRGPLLAEYLRVMSESLQGRAELQQLLANLTAYDLYVFVNGFRPGAPSVVDLFYSMFLHAGFLHLFGNMLFLWIYGDNVEHRLGAVRYLLAYLGTGVAATLFHAVSTPGSQIPMVGASGAISGVLGFYFLFFARNRVRLLWLLPPFIWHVFEVPARLVLGMYLIVDNLLPYLFAGSDVGVAHGAHIGGFVAGLGVAWLMERRAVDGKPRDFAAEPREAPVASIARASGRAVGERIGDAIDAGRLDAAARAYFALPAAATRRLLTPEQALRLATWLRREGHDEAALVVLRRLIRDFPLGETTARACVLAGQILLDDEDQATAAYQYFLDALDLGPDPETEAAARSGIATIEMRQKRRFGAVHRLGGA